MAKNPDKIKYLDPYDHFLLVAIGEGVDSCTYLANVTGKPKQTVSLRVENLEECGLVDRQEAPVKHFNVVYVLTAKGRKIVANTCLDLNANFLGILKK